MAKPLPTNPNLSSLKKQAKHLLRNFRNNDVDAHNTVSQLHPHPERFTSLRDAQLVVARSYGFSGWQDLSDAVENAALNALSLKQLADEYIDLACVRYDSKDSSKRYLRANRLLEQNPELSKVNLITAIVSHDFTTVEKILNESPEVVSQSYGPRNWLPLMYLTYNRVADTSDNKNSVKITELLLSSGADPNAHYIADYNYRFTALTGAMGEGEGGVQNQPPHQFSKEIAKILLDAGATPNDSQGLYNTMFTGSGDYWLKLLASYGLNKNDKVNWVEGDNAGLMLDYLLETSISRKNISRIKYLLSLGANPNARCHYSNRTIYTSALIDDDKDILSDLERSGAAKDQLTDEDLFLIALREQDKNKATQLFQNNPELLKDPNLLENASVDIVKALVELGFDFQQQSENGITLLHVKARKGDLESVKYLLDIGADPEYRDKYYQGKAVGHAHFHNQIEVRDYLLERYNYIIESSACGNIEALENNLKKDPSEVNTPGLHGNTALHVVCNWRGANADFNIREAIIGLLINSGADLNIKNNQGQTPLEFNILENEEDNVFLLKEMGA